MNTNFSILKSSCDDTLFAKDGILKPSLAILLCIGTLVACAGNHVTGVESTSEEPINHGDLTEEELYKKIKSRIQEAREHDFVNCGVYGKTECRIYQENFKTTAVETIIESQGADSLICCVTRISLQKKEQNCVDLSVYSQRLNNNCPKGWWEIEP